jgi:lysyl-tRNA synthetase class 1
VLGVTQAAAAPTTEHAEPEWLRRVAGEVEARARPGETVTCAAGISPSGPIHVGNLRDVMTALQVADALARRGHATELLLSWDEFDRLRRAPTGFEAAAEHEGKPLRDIPDPLGEHPSYAARFERDFESALDRLGVEVSYRYQADEYRSGRYDDAIVHALRHRERIAEILFRFMSDIGRERRGLTLDAWTESYFPLSVYSRFTGTDETTVLGYDGESTITYRCERTGQEDTVDLREHRIAKLPWKVDWAMRWREENVLMEPAGKDHGAPGGSFDVSSAICREVFDHEPPVFVMYEFIGIRGVAGKMSGSTGAAVSPGEVLEIYEPAMLEWQYFRRDPAQAFSLAFDSEVYRQYDEFDREVKQARDGTLPPVRLTALRLSGVDLEGEHEKAIPFRQAVGLGQIVQWDVDVLDRLMRRLDSPYDRATLESRVPRARTWLERYNPDALIRLLDAPNAEYAATLPPERLAQVHAARALVRDGVADGDIKALEGELYAIPRRPEVPEDQLKATQRAFFKDMYNLLLGRDQGPRLSTFLWALDSQRIDALLDV